MITSLRTFTLMEILEVEEVNLCSFSNIPKSMIKKKKERERFPEWQYEEPHKPALRKQP